MNNTMNAWAATAPGKLEPVTLPIPEPDDYEVLVKNEGCSFCNSTDKMIIDRLFATRDYPVVFGHESFGRVIKAGKRVTKFKLGDRVICTNAIVKGFDGTYHSTWGGFAEYGIAGDLEAWLADGGTIAGENAYRRRYKANFAIPGDLPPEEACLVFPLAEVSGAILQAGDLNGKTVAVIGTGIVGYFFTFFARRFGAERVVCLGRREERLSVARAAGADATFIDPNEAAAAGMADIVFECSGNWRVLEKGLPYLREGGLLAVYAVPSQPYAMDLAHFPKDFTCRRIGPDVAAGLPSVCRLLEERQVPIELFLTHQWSFEEVPAAFEQVRAGEVIKGLVNIK